MDLVTPSIGLIVWQSIIFILLITILGKYAWKPIIKIISTREESISLSLQNAKKANLEVEKIKSQREDLLKEISLQKNQMLKELELLREKLEVEARKSAKNQADLILEKAKKEIEAQKTLAIEVLKNKMAEISISIAEKLLKAELSENQKQKKLLETLVKEI